MIVIAYRRQLAVSINGTQVVNTNLDTYAEWNERMCGVNQDRGYIGLQSWRGRTEFRNIVVKHLGAAPPLAPPAADQTTRVDRIDIVEKGIYRSESNPGSFEGLQLAEDTATIPAQTGTIFGFRYVVVGEPSVRNLPLRVVLIYPEAGLQNPQTGKTVHSEEYYDSPRITARAARYHKLGSWGWVFGVWTYQIWYQGRKYAEQQFTVAEQ
jgi:hypothetical protein